MNDNKIYSADLKKLLPDVLKNNKDIQALSTLIEIEIKKLFKDIEKNKIFCNISNLDETTLDILAYDLKILWYDYRYPLKIKREIIKDCIKVYKELGTRYAVDKALKSVFPKTKIFEWYEYNGDPYTFKIEIDISETGAEKYIQETLIKKIKYYKNLRSHLKHILYIYESKNNKILVKSAVAQGNTSIVYPILNPYLGLIGQTKIISGTTAGQNLTVYPQLKDNINVKQYLGFTSYTHNIEEITVYPQLKDNINVKQYLGFTAYLQQGQQLIIYPNINNNITKNNVIKYINYVQITNTLNVYPN